MLTPFKVAIQWLFLFVSGFVMDFLGLFIVAIAIPFRVNAVSGSDGRPIVNLPKWAWLWGNDYDGLLGDKLGEWATEVPFGVSIDSFFAMWWWAAIRNPSNNMRFVSLWAAPIIGSTITYKGAAHVRDHDGEAGWQFVTVENGGRHWYCFYLVHQWSTTRAFVIRMGFKVEPADAGTNEVPQGCVTKINLYKAI
ncbi:hypothetical protein [Pseudomonas sp. dw_358]|uniref:DUF7338 family protein n=1 Tax=Pseudomonas sp. dw_358 TaxID=2720083 RepID=UPI001BD42EA6|nr:hypothetical protein [Pseudomonas sp. dw_358]